MVCPNCDAPELRVLETRALGGGSVVRRRRYCPRCDRRFATVEMFVGRVFELNLKVEVDKRGLVPTLTTGDSK